MNYSYNNTSCELLISYNSQNIQKNFTISKDILSILSLFSNRVKNPGKFKPFGQFTWTNLPALPCAKNKKYQRLEGVWSNFVSKYYIDRSSYYQRIVHNRLLSGPFGSSLRAIHMSSPSGGHMHQRILRWSISPEGSILWCPLGKSPKGNLKSKKKDQVHQLRITFGIWIALIKHPLTKKNKTAPIHPFRVYASIYNPLRVSGNRACSINTWSITTYYILLLVPPPGNKAFLQVLQVGACLILDFYIKKFSKQKIQFCRAGKYLLSFLFFIIGVDSIIKTKISSFFLANFYYIKNQKILKLKKQFKKDTPLTKKNIFFGDLDHDRQRIFWWPEYLAIFVDRSTNIFGHILKIFALCKRLENRACEIKKTHQETVNLFSIRDYQKQLLKFILLKKFLVNRTFNKHFKTDRKKRFILWRIFSENKSKNATNFIKLLNFNIIYLFKNFYTFFWIGYFKNCLVYNLRFHQYLKWIYVFFYPSGKKSFLFFSQIYFIFIKKGTYNNLTIINKKKLKNFLSKINFVILKIVIYITSFFKKNIWKWLKKNKKTPIKQIRTNNIIFRHNKKTIYPSLLQLSKQKQSTFYYLE